jgi:hypothetical protein
VRYILLIHDDEKAFWNLSEAERQALYTEYRSLREQLTAAGNWVGGDQLQPTSAARSVKVRDGKPVVTSGPFAETREQLGGYFLIEARDLEEAVSIAARIPSARLGTIEVRPVVPSPVPAGAR